MTITETKNVYTLNINIKELYKNFVYLSNKYINNDVCGNKKFLLLILLVAIYFGKETRMINENINLQNILQQQQVFSLLKGGASNRKTKQNRKTKKNGKTKKKMKGGNLLLRFLICLGIVIFLVLIRYERIQKKKQNFI